MFSITAEILMDGKPNFLCIVLRMSKELEENR